MARILVRTPPRAPRLDEARDELFSHILRSGVISEPREQQRQWLAGTMAYLADRYPDLSPDLIELLRERAEHFCGREAHEKEAR